MKCLNIIAGNRGGWRDREALQEGEWEESTNRGGKNSSMGRNSRTSWDIDKEKENHMSHKQWEEDNLPEWYVYQFVKL